MSFSHQYNKKNKNIGKNITKYLSKTKNKVKKNDAVKRKLKKTHKK
jgi:hypothetical protein